MSQDLSPLKVLLIDDDLDDQEIFELALQCLDQPVHYVTASSGEDGLNLLGNEKEKLPDFIFLDLNMPRMNGWECLKEIKSRPALQQVPVVIYTTSSELHDKNETADRGAHSLMTKPSNINELAGLLSGLFRSGNFNINTKHTHISL